MADTMGKIMKTMKVESVSDMTDKAWTFLYQASQNEEVRRDRAIRLAQIMTGQLTWQGFQPHMHEVSGLARLANNWLRSKGYDWRISEHAFGDGTSVYNL